MLMSDSLLQTPVCNGHQTGLMVLAKEHLLSSKEEGEDFRCGSLTSQSLASTSEAAAGHGKNMGFGNRPELIPAQPITYWLCSFGQET